MHLMEDSLGLLRVFYHHNNDVMERNYNEASTEGLNQRDFIFVTQNTKV